MELVIGEGRRAKLIEMALADRYALVVCYDMKAANEYKRAGVPSDRVFTRSTVKDRSKGRMVAPPYYLIADEADLLLGYAMGQPIGVMGLPDDWRTNDR